MYKQNINLNELKATTLLVRGWVKEENFIDVEEFTFVRL